MFSSRDKNFFEARSQAKHLFQGSRAIQDPKTTEFVFSLLESGLQKSMSSDFLKEFENTFADWLCAHSTNRITGLENFDAHFSTGTTQGFDSFYFRHRHCRFRCLVGEYFYHLKTWESNGVHWEFITDADTILPGDALVISVPFCDNGGAPSNYEKILKKCAELNVPVLVDCCYFPISGGLEINLNYSCIDTVCFSLSKSFPVARMRIGMRYLRKGIYDGQALHSNINYNNNLSALLGLKIINQFGSDYMYCTYIDRQNEICSKLPGLTATNCISFAVGDEEWSQYSRANLLEEYQLNFNSDMFKNRIFLGPIYEQWNIWKTYVNSVII